jgi:hypothetical protein
VITADPKTKLGKLKHTLAKVRDGLLKAILPAAVDTAARMIKRDVLMSMTAASINFR